MTVPAGIGAKEVEKRPFPAPGMVDWDTFVGIDQPWAEQSPFLAFSEARVRERDMTWYLDIGGYRERRV
jgi:hypothetical protein